QLHFVLKWIPIKIEKGLGTPPSVPSLFAVDALMVHYRHHDLLQPGVKRQVLFILALPIPMGSPDKADDLNVDIRNTECLSKAQDMRTTRLGACLPGQ
ncbi:MAG: hypothetical protein GY801_26000, partial [bacterium]|nr:hypothetical protein [bacterium]